MNDFHRFAIYYAPESGAFNDFGAAWLGWDALRGAATEHPDVPGLPRPLAEITETPRKYGLHATIKPPFRLAEGLRAEDLHRAAGALCAGLAPVTLPGLGLHRLGGFLALTPLGDVQALGHLADAVVTRLDCFRAAPTAAEVARRRPDRLTPPQRANLATWGYPYVMGEFRFHITLTGTLPSDEAAVAARALAPLIAPVLPAPFRVPDLCLFGEAADGRFRLIHRYPLGGAG